MGDDGLPPRMTAATRLGLDRLKEVTFWDFVTVRVPERWQSKWHKKGRWECSDRDADSGTLWIDHNYREAIADHLSEEAWREEMRDILSCMMSRAGHSQEPPLATTLIDLDPWHAVIYTAGTDPEPEPDGEFLHKEAWHHFGLRRPYSIVVHLNLVIPVYALEFEEARRLLALMQRELLGPMIDWDGFRSRLTG